MTLAHHPRLAPPTPVLTGANGLAVPARPGHRLSPLALLHRARAEAPQVVPWSERVEEPLAERAYELVAMDDDVEVWVIHWPAGGHLELHDHGGSAGALVVVGGTLEETYVGPDGLAGRRLGSGGGTAFGPAYVHDVVNTGVGPATSVHVYSPPLPAMTFYRHGEHGLTADRTEYRSDPSWAP